MSKQILVVRLPHAEGLPLPAYATLRAAGMDLLAAVTEPLVIAPGARALVPTGLRIALPPGHELQVRPRSGLALKHGLTVPNAPGTVDEDFRGEIQVIVLNAGNEPFTVERGMRIAQAVVAPVVRATWLEVAELPETARGAGGFGSTGTALVPDEAGGNFRMQWSPPAGPATDDGADGKVTLKAFGVRPTRDGRVALRDPDTGEIEIVSWEAATEMGLWPTRVQDQAKL